MSDSKAKPKVAVTTAGLRGTTWNAERLPKDVKISIHPLATGKLVEVVVLIALSGAWS